MNTLVSALEETTDITKLYTQLAEDRALLEEGLDVGDSGVIAPRLAGAEDKRTGVAKRLARMLYPVSEEARSWSYIRYGRLVSQLRNRYLEQQKHTQPLRPEHNLYRTVRAPGQRELFETLLQSPFSESILHPVPMPVEIAPFEELAPILTFVGEGSSMLDELTQFTRGTLFPDGRIDMCKQVVADRHIGSLVESMSMNGHIRHLLLGNNIVGDEGAVRIAQLLHEQKEDSTLETLYLAGNRIGPVGVRAVCEALRSNQSVKALWLKRNPLYEEGVRHVAELLETTDRLETLDLVNTGLLDGGVKVLFQGLRKNQSVRTLYVDANGITVEGAREIAAYFEHLKAGGKVGLTGLFLAVNRLGDEGARLIAEAVRGYPHLERLELSSNRIQTSGLPSLLEIFAAMKSLRFLGLGYYKSAADLGELPNYFDGEGADLIADFLRHNSTLQMMDITDTNLRPGGIEHIVEALQENESLLQLAYAQFRRPQVLPLQAGLDAILEKNVKAALGIDLPTFREETMRYIKHTESVKHIDSIYRNNM